MRILFLTQASFYTNASILRPMELHRFAGCYGVDSRILLQDAPSNQELVEKLQLENCGYYDSSWDLYQRIRDERSQGATHIYTINTGYVAAGSSLLATHRAMRFIRDYDEYLPSAVRQPSRRIVHWLFHQINVRVCDYQVFAARALMRYLNPTVPSLYLSYAMCDVLHGNFMLPSLKPVDRPYIVYVGKLSKIYNVDELVRLIKLAQARAMHVVIVGTGDAEPDLKARLKHLDLQDAAVFTGWVPPGGVEMSSIIGNSLACFLPLEDTVQNRCRCPSKLFNYAALHKPIITNRVGAIADILDSQGVYYRYGDEDSLAACIDSVVRANVGGVNIDHLTWESQASRFYRFLKDGTNRSS